MKVVTDDNIKKVTLKKQGFILFLEDILLENPKKQVNLTPPLSLLRDSMIRIAQKSNCMAT